MSRIGNSKIEIPQGVTVAVEDGGDYDYKQVKVVGPKGELVQSIRPNVKVDVAEKEIAVSRVDDTIESKSLHGMYRSLINNMVVGVYEGYTKELHIEGIGYRAQVVGEDLELSVGYSHKILAKPPVGVSVEVEDQTEIKITGVDKQAVGNFAATVRAYRKPEPYKGKGIRYKDEQIVRKDTKAS